MINLQLKMVRLIWVPIHGHAPLCVYWCAWTAVGIGVDVQRDYSSKNVEHAFTMIISLRIHSLYSHLLSFLLTSRQSKATGTGQQTFQGAES